jgi:hypothetical protein
VADRLRLSMRELRERLRAGNSLEEIAAARGVPPQALYAALQGSPVPAEAPDRAAQNVMAPATPLPARSSSPATTPRPGAAAGAAEARTASDPSAEALAEGTEGLAGPAAAPDDALQRTARALAADVIAQSLRARPRRRTLLAGISTTHGVAPRLDARV